MPMLSWVQSIAAGATFDPLQNSLYERMPVSAIVKILSSATAVGLLQSVICGSETIVEESPVPLYGAAGVFPTEQYVDPIVDEAVVGDKVRIRYRNPTGGAIEAHGTFRF